MALLPRQGCRECLHKPTAQCGMELKGQPGMSLSWAAQTICFYPMFLLNIAPAWWKKNPTKQNRKQEDLWDSSRKMAWGLPHCRTHEMGRCTHGTDATRDQQYTHTHYPLPTSPCKQGKSSETLPRKAIPFFCSSSGNLGFSEACPQPAHTA